MRAVLAAVLVTSILSGSGAAQSFNYPDFSLIAGVTLNGSASQSGINLQLTPAVNSQYGSAYHSQAVPVAGGFDTTFTFQVLTPGADGFTFIIQNDAAGPAALNAASGGPLGYGGTGAISNCLVVEFDNYLNGNNGDSSSNEISIHTGGTGPNNQNESASIGRVTPSTTFADGGVHTARIEYIPGTLNVYLDNLTTPILTTNYDIFTGGTYLNGASIGGLTLINGSMVYAGFTAATGGLSQAHEILSWQWTSASPPPGCYEGNIVDAQGALTNLLLVNGSAGGYFHTVAVPAFQTFSFDFLAPPLNPNPAPFIIWGHIGAPSLASIYTSPFGTMCFGPEFLYPAPWHFTLVDSFTNSPSAILPGTNAPWSFTVPGGIGTAITFALQGFTAADATTLGISNAVIVDVQFGPPPVISSVLPLAAAPTAPITITGTDFQPGLTIKIDGVPVTPTSITATSVEFLMPSLVSCDASIVITNPDGQSSSAATFNPTPSINNTLLPQGPAAGNQVFYMVGSGFSPGSTVTIGGNAATINSLTPALIIVSTPPGSLGTAMVVVTTPTGCMTTTNYTYL